jgi:hypothetical protein
MVVWCGGQVTKRTSGSMKQGSEKDQRKNAGNGGEVWMMRSNSITGSKTVSGGERAGWLRDSIVQLG